MIMQKQVYCHRIYRPHLHPTLSMHIVTSPNDTNAKKLKYNPFHQISKLIYDRPSQPDFYSNSISPPMRSLIDFTSICRQLCHLLLQFSLTCPSSCPIPSILFRLFAL